MRAILVLFLLVFINCESFLINTTLCLFADPKFQEFAKSVANLILDKDYEKIIPTFIEFYPGFRDNFHKCLTKEESKKETTIVKGSWYESDWIIWE